MVAVLSTGSCSMIDSDPSSTAILCFAAKGESQSPQSKGFGSRAWAFLEVTALT